MQHFTPKGLKRNSLTSLVASAMMVVPTLLIPFLLNRTITMAEYAIYATILSYLPLVNILAQSVRLASASRIRTLCEIHDHHEVRASFFAIIICVLIIQMIIITAIVELFLQWIGIPDTINIMRYGMLCLNINVMGTICIALLSSNGSAQSDFLPENIAKPSPNLLLVIGFALVFSGFSSQSLDVIFLVLAISPWLIFMLLLVLYWIELPNIIGKISLIKYTIMAHFFRTYLGHSWWNLMAYLATAVSVTLVAIFHSQYIVAFSIATMLVGLSAAIPNAIMGPLAVKVNIMDKEGVTQQTSFFRRVNSFFQIYIILISIAILLIPEKFFNLWVGPILGPQVQLFIYYLLPAYALRLLIMAFNIYIISYGKQEKLILSPAIEAFSATVGGLILASIYGITGIAFALLLAAIIRLLLTITMDRKILSEHMRISARDFLFSFKAIGMGRL